MFDTFSTLLMLKKLWSLQEVDHLTPWAYGFDQNFLQLQAEMYNYFRPDQKRTIISLLSNTKNSIFSRMSDNYCICSKENLNISE